MASYAMMFMNGLLELNRLNHPKQTPVRNDSRADSVPLLKKHIVPYNHKVGYNLKDEHSKEAFIRATAERMTGYKFNKTRGLPWLVNPETKRRLEIDMYCKELNLGIETHGIQHYKFIPHLHKTVVAFKKMVERDNLKRTLCQKNGLKLIVIPCSINHEDVEPLLLQEFAKGNFKMESINSYG